MLSIFFTQDSEFRSFFGRIDETINCFRDLLTFSYWKSLNLDVWNIIDHCAAASYQRQLTSFQFVSALESHGIETLS